MSDDVTPRLNIVRISNFCWGKRDTLSDVKYVSDDVKYACTHRRSDKSSTDCTVRIVDLTSTYFKNKLEFSIELLIIKRNYFHISHVHVCM